MENPKVVIRCLHCGNVTPHQLLLKHAASLLYEQFEEEEKYFEPFDFYVYACGTCGGVNVLGGFRHELGADSSKHPRLYPRGPFILPSSHMLHKADPVPVRILKAYQSAWSLRPTLPNAFAGQIRRALEMLCEDQGVKGKDLYSRLQKLSEKGILPTELLVDAAHLIRNLGNVGVHAGTREVDFWDAELVDELFRAIIEFVYILPSKVERMRQRLSGEPQAVSPIAKNT